MTTAAARHPGRAFVSLGEVDRSGKPWCQCLSFFAGGIDASMGAVFANEGGIH
jgi:hypothetical protein